jgi:hypothetical protein
MAKAEKVELVKVFANYGVREDSLTLWGVDFMKEGEGDEVYYAATVEAEIAQSLLDAKRVFKAK